jgi:arylsulfatase A-like enzyme
MSSTANLPDIVIIHCHDLGRWLPIYGMPHVPAPNLATFAQESVVFENAHSAAPLCSPARGAIFTGMTPYRNGIQGLKHAEWRYRKGVSTIPERLRPLGYHSALIGLQHENWDPTVLGYDEVPGMGFLPRTSQVVDAANEWLTTLPNRDQRDPLFLVVGTWEVHRPWKTEDYKPANPETVDVPDYLPDNSYTRDDIASFYGSIAQFDEGFGRLLKHIDATLDRNNTMVIMTTDHGAAFPRAKSTLYEAGTGVSLIIRPPAGWGTRPKRITNLVSHLDLLPTFMDIAGGSTDDWLEGESLLPLLRDNQPPIDNDRILFTSKTYHDGYDPMRAVRSADYLYVRNYEPGPQLDLPGDIEKGSTRKGMGDKHLAPRKTEEFYDRRTDPHELVNVIDDPQYEEVRRRYAGLLHEWLQRCGDPIETAPIPPAPARSRHVDDLDPIEIKGGSSDAK